MTIFTRTLTAYSFCVDLHLYVLTDAVAPFPSVSPVGVYKSVMAKEKMVLYFKCLRENQYQDLVHF